MALERTAFRTNCWLLLLSIVKAPPVALRVKTPFAVPMDWVPVTWESTVMLPVVSVRACAVAPDVLACKANAPSAVPFEEPKVRLFADCVPFKPTNVVVEGLLL